MTIDPAPRAAEKVRTVAISLYPEQDNIVRTFAGETGRTYSNAVQFIVGDWARMKRAAITAAAPQPEEAA